MYRYNYTKQGEDSIGIAAPCDNLRDSLRGATAHAHDLLDHAMRAASGWETREDYAGFLTLQYSARLPVEAWLARHAPPTLRPPPQCPLIARDLAMLGERLPDAATRFAPHLAVSAAPGNAFALGIAWVLAGSALGNRGILKQVERIGAAAAGAHGWPRAFLADEAMLQFWTGLRRRIERPADHVEAEAASRAASCVFDHFLAAASAPVTSPVAPPLPPLSPAP